MPFQVVHKYRHAPTTQDVFIGRPSVLGNPFTHVQSRATRAEVRVESREAAVLAYAQWLWHRVMILRDPVILAALRAIPDGANLVCYCTPALCHGEVIAHCRDWLDQHVWPEPAQGYVITKASRTPDTQSYDGPSWDRAGLRHQRRDVYASYDEARTLAQALTAINPVGFTVTPIF